MIYHNAAKRILTAPKGADRRSQDRLSLLLRSLDTTTSTLPYVAVLGESGKSAVATMLSYALTSAGYRVGTMATPFSHTMTECVAVNGTPISMDAFADCVTRVFDATAKLQETIRTLPELSEEEKESLTENERLLYAYKTSSEDFSLFSDELLLAAALLYFTENSCQIAVIEIPSGERRNAYRLPSSPLISVITTTESEAEAKALCPLLDRKTNEIVSATQRREIANMISSRCAAINCRLTYPLKNKLYLTQLATNRLQAFYKDMEFTLHSGAPYQLQNLTVVLETLDALKRGGFAVDPAAATVQPLYGMAGVPLQFTTVALEPNVITDFADTPTRRRTLAQDLSCHKHILRSKLTIIAPASEEPDELICQPFLEKELAIETILRADLSNPRRTLKPVVKALSSEDTLVILGSRPFVYEIHRALMGLLHEKRTSQ